MIRAKTLIPLNTPTALTRQQESFLNYPRRCVRDEGPLSDVKKVLGAAYIEAMSWLWRST